MRWLVPILLLSLVACARPLEVAGLRPLSPEPYNLAPKLQSLQPALRWESFPRPTDLDADRGGWVSRVRHVTYDLRIWRARGSGDRQAPGVLVYARDALPASEHKVETSLDRKSWYFWTVRARFRLNGRTRVTEWSRVDTPDSPRVPDSRYFRFYLD